MRHDRANSQNGGGCAAFLKDGLAYRVVPSPEDMKCTIVDVYSPGKEGNIKINNMYNPCRRLEMFKEMAGTVYRKNIWCGDFNAHSSL